MRTKICLEIDGNDATTLLQAVLKQFQVNSIRKPIPFIKLVYVQGIDVDPVFNPDSPLIIYDPLTGIDDDNPQTYAVNLYNTPDGVTYSFGNTGDPESLQFPRTRAVDGSLGAPGSVIHQIQTEAAVISNGLPVMSSQGYYVTFSVNASGYTFRHAIPTPGPSSSPYYPTQSSFPATCVQDDILPDGSYRIFQVSYSADPSDTDYFVWKKIILGGTCDNDAGAVQNLLLQTF